MRIVAISDQHGFLPEIPPCDLLIVAGDVCPDMVAPESGRPDAGRQKDWFDTHARPWLEAAPAAHKILTWGNHDWCGQRFSFADDRPGIAPTSALQIVVDEAVAVPSNHAGSGAISVWASPWSRRFMDWAFMKPTSELSDIYAAIPAGIDILVSHQPPFGFGDRQFTRESGRHEHLGCRALLSAVERIRPRLLICGHIHAGYGAFQHHETQIRNVSVVNEQYELVRPATVIDIADW